jgi:peptidyl-prolyl cis-trans isomerase B (cyclophilin B)
VSPSKREREYARRRHSKWQGRRETTAARRARRRQAALVVTAVVAVVAVAVGAFVLMRPDGTDTAADAATVATPTDSPSEPVPEDAENPCPASTATPNPDPAQLDEVPDPAGAEGRTWQVTLETSCGPVAMELDGGAAPQAVASFLELSRSGYYDGTPCHRLTTEGIFVLQCGDPTATGQGGPGYAYGPVENAPADDVYPTGTLAMARVGDDGESMGSQFFLVYADSTIPGDSAGGYTVFGRITSGLDVVQQVADGGTGADGTAPARSISIDGVGIQ